MIVLPKGAFIVKQKVIEYESTSSLILDDSVKEELSEKFAEGIIAFTSEELNEYQGCTVFFRENFSEPIEIEGVKYLYFRDFNSSIYYLIK